MDKMVHKPNHYNQVGISCIDAIRMLHGDEIAVGFMIGNAFKYNWRFSDKDGIRDVKKSKEYLEMMRESDYEVLAEMIDRRNKKKSLQQEVDELDQKIKEFKEEEESTDFDETFNRHIELMCVRNAKARLEGMMELEKKIAKLRTDIEVVQIMKETCDEHLRLYYQSFEYTLAGILRDCENALGRMNNG